MKILFIGNIFEISGWSKAAEGHVRALNEVGVDVTICNIKLTNVPNPDTHPLISDLAKRPIGKPDVIILNTLPFLYQRSSAKTIGYYMSETDRLTPGWSSSINLLDHAIVPCYTNKQASIASNVKIPISVIPLVNTVESVEYPIHPVRKNFGNDKFIFYTVGEWTQRKNVEDIIRAFHLEFSPSEPVELLIKTTPQGMQNPAQFINETVERIKSGLGIYRDISRLKRENIICNYTNEDEINSIHSSCDCFVSASHGEAWCLPAFNALAFGNSVVVPNWGGFAEYCTEKNSYLVSGREDYVHDCEGYAGTSKYFYPSIESLRENMRKAYSLKAVNLKKKQQAAIDMKKFSIENVGRQYKQVLEKVLQ